MLRMDPASLATTMVGAQTGLMQLELATRLERMNADQGANVAKLIDAAQRSFNSLANVASGVGQNLNISA
jgi:hypothetical protein